VGVTAINQSPKYRHKFLAIPHRSGGGKPHFIT
jgi:hypothetical protein